MTDTSEGYVLRTASGLTAFLAAVLLTGCAAVGPKYVRPTDTVSAQWHSGPDSSLAFGEADPQALAQWWNALGDPELSGLVERAVKGNRDLRQAEARVREARARRGASQASLLPTLDASGSASRSQSSKKTGGGATRNMFQAGFDAGWELDLFGGTRRSVEASTADLQASQEDLHDVLVSLVAEVALNYTELRTYQTRLSVAEQNLAAQSETYQLARWRAQAGLSDELAVEQARYNLESTRSQIPTLQTGLEGALNRLAVLLGEQPGALHSELEQRGTIPVTPLSVAVGIPADMLRRRPDIRHAERQLAAQTARVGVAKADLYPKLSLSGSIGLEALSLDNLFTSGSRAASGSSLISWPIFRGGSIRKNIQVQSALQEQYLAAYESSVLGAVEEVENALTAYAKEQKRRQSLSAAAAAAGKAADLARQEYEAGLTDFSSILEAQRSLLSFQDQLAQSDGAVTSDLISLYKALGGGWTSLAPETSGLSNTEKN
ncbi:efflux transporter outer membrane subunit [bacterium]|nr:efflux transporter outer membrane subunit [bacterium]